MKKWVVMAVVLAALLVGTRATYADGGWATAGKVLTGFVAADILFNHVGPCYGGYAVNYGYPCGGPYYGYGAGYYAAPPVYYAAPPVVYYRPYYHYPRYYRYYPARRW